MIVTSTTSWLRASRSPSYQVDEPEPDENPPLGIILCAGKNTEQIELLELDASGIHVAEYLTVLPPPEVLREKLHAAIETARARIEAQGGEG